jgi:choline dehydrogenase-like flavoprotein
MMRDAYDYLIVGGGTAGAVVAARLSQRAGVSACLLEAGPPDRGIEAISDMRRWEDLLGSRYDYDFALQAEPDGNPHLRLAAGRVLGGSSALNTSFAFMAPDVDLARWEERGAADWGPDAVRDSFTRVREALSVEVPEAPSEASRAFVQAAAQAGFPLVEHGGSELREGVGWMPLSSKGVQRRSSAELYLHPLSARAPRLALRTDCRVRRILFDDHGAATGVELADGGTVAAREEVIVCCGAINTPKLLMLSGIGPDGELVDRPEVGRNLADHPLAVITWAAARTSPPSELHGWEAGLFARSTPALDEPDLFMMFATAPYDAETRPHGYPAESQGFSIAPFPMRPRSTGSVRLGSDDPDAPPLVRLGHFSDPDGRDAEATSAAIELARSIAAQPALAPWLGAELAPGARVHGDDLERYVRRTSGTMYHPAGTCRMGTDGDAVVAQDLRVRGVDRLRIADASVLPSLVSVTPYLTCLMIGERCATLVLDSARSGVTA